jgi:hypothetical protein
MKPRPRFVLACCFFGAAALYFVAAVQAGEVPTWWELASAILTMVAGTIQLRAESREARGRNETDRSEDQS